MLELNLLQEILLSAVDKEHLTRKDGPGNTRYNHALNTAVSLGWMYIYHCKECDNKWTAGDYSLTVAGKEEAKKLQETIRALSRKAGIST